MGPEPRDRLRRPARLDVERSRRSEPVGKRWLRAEQREVAAVADRGRRLGERVDRRPGERAADTDALRTRACELGEAQVTYREDVDRLRDGVTDGADLVQGAQAGGVEDVRARRRERLQARDRVVEVRVAAQMVLGARSA